MQADDTLNKFNTGKKRERRAFRRGCGNFYPAESDIAPGADIAGKIKIGRIIINRSQKLIGQRIKFQPSSGFIKPSNNITMAEARLQKLQPPKRSIGGKNDITFGIDAGSKNIQTHFRECPFP